ncbi:lipoyl synthase [Candidatus Poribacteria bacterium]|nr:lipoyl synthase [Candidatus Poribacteria bacterium]
MSKHPAWIKAKIPWGQNFFDVKRMLQRLELHTVCEEARCPNIGECWNSRTATFMILGNICTRRCKFCAVAKGVPTELDKSEPERIGKAASELRLKHLVITSVTRDDLVDGGASIFACCIMEARKYNPGCSIEVLIPDFQGNFSALAKVIAAQPDVLNHNLETVSRLYPYARPKADYQRSLTLLRQAKEPPSFPPVDGGVRGGDILTKSGLMVGLGETVMELLQTMRDLRDLHCDLLTIGQYLSPSQNHLPVARYYHPEEFEELKEVGKEMGFRHVESGPLVRSSYHARQQVSQFPKERTTRRNYN